MAINIRVTDGTEINHPAKSSLHKTPLILQQLREQLVFALCVYMQTRTLFTWKVIATEEDNGAAKINAEALV